MIHNLRLTLLVAAAMLVCTVVTVSSAGASSSRPVVSFVSPSPADGAVTGSSVSFKFTYNRTPGQTRLLVCTLVGPTHSLSACDPATVSGSGSQSGKSYTGLANGSYIFTVAVFAADGGLAVATRQFKVRPPAPISTTATPGGSAVAVGSSQHDEATVGIAQNPGKGTVTFTLCTPSQVTAAGCPVGSGTQVGSPVSLDSHGHASSALVNGSTTVSDNAGGTYCWRADFTPVGGSGNYSTSTHTDAAGECFTVASADVSLRVEFTDESCDSEACRTANTFADNAGPSAVTVSYELHFLCGSSSGSTTGSLTIAPHSAEFLGGIGVTAGDSCRGWAQITAADVVDPDSTPDNYTGGFDGPTAEDDELTFVDNGPAT